jgi:hypothetical protein
MSKDRKELKWGKPKLIVLCKGDGHKEGVLRDCKTQVGGAAIGSDRAQQGCQYNYGRWDPRTGYRCGPCSDINPT